MKTPTTTTYKKYIIETTTYAHDDGTTYDRCMVSTPKGGSTCFKDSVETAKKYIDDQPVNRSPKNFKFANFHGYSDCHAYEIVRVVSEKTIIVRRMTATLIPFKMDFHPGGFLGHVSNQRDQKYTYEPTVGANEYRAHRRKDGHFYSANGKHVLSETPYEFYDYNF